MKKLTVIIAIIITILCLTKKENVIIPKEAIRFRVIANSNTEQDQALKEQVVLDLSENIKKLELLPKNIETSRMKIKESIPELKKSVEETLKNNDSEITYGVNYGTNYFPEKSYKGITYEEGEYESLIVTLGDGLGDNFWCVLFPPLCLLDGEETEETDIEYTSFIKELIDKYF